MVIGSQRQRYLTGLKTAVFKLHNPSRRKRALLDYSLRQNHFGYDKALGRIAPSIAELAEAELQERQAQTALPRADEAYLRRARKFGRERVLRKDITTVIKPLPVAVAAKAGRSIPGAIIGRIERYIELRSRHPGTGLPPSGTRPWHASDHADALRRLAESTTLGDEELARNDLQRAHKPAEWRPLIFAINRPGDGFLILKNPDTGAYFAFLNLVRKDSRFAHLTAAESRNRSSRIISGLVDIRTGEAVDFASTTGCLFPLEFSRDYQVAQFLACGRSLSAKLIKVEDRFELHVTFEFTAPEVTPVSVMGVQRGLGFLASVAVVDADGRIVDQRNFDGSAVRRAEAAAQHLRRSLQRRGRDVRGRVLPSFVEERLHVVANEIVLMALRHKAQVVLEDLTNNVRRHARRAAMPLRRLHRRSRYFKLQRVLEYKLPLAGLRRLIHVHPGHTLDSCPDCGLRTPENLSVHPPGGVQRQLVFRCVDCGYTADPYLNAARLVALKRQWRDGLAPALRILPMDAVPADKNFAAFLRVRAKRREDSAHDRKIGSSGRVGLDGHDEDGEAPPSDLTVRPRSGSNTLAGQGSPTMLSAASPSDEIPRLESQSNDGRTRETS